MKIALSNRRMGQASLEILLILGVVLLAFLVFFFLTQSQSIEVKKKKASAEAANAVHDLASAAEEVYAQGIGARKQVYVTLPEEYEQNGSLVGNRAVRLRVAGNDYVETTDFNVHGSLPKTPGNHWVWVVSEGENVRIGLSMIDLSRVSVNVLMPRNSIRFEELGVRSDWSQPINITISRSWESREVELSIDKPSFSLDPLSSEGISITFISNNNATGFNSGYIELHASDGLQEETLNVPLTIEIAASEAVPELTIMPGVFNVTAEPNSTVSKVFQVCTKTSLDSVQFNLSKGDAGVWIRDADPLGPMSADTCQPKKFSLDIPDDSSPGEYTGYILGEGIGARHAKDSVHLYVLVSREIAEDNEPNISEIRHYPSKVWSPEPVVISAAADDTVSGNSSIRSCEISLDQSTWDMMDPVDGAYDEPLEKARYTIFQGLGLGKHEALIRCTDSQGNSDLKGYSFNVMKEILFVKKANQPAISENEWIGWISRHKSGEGLTWSYDVVESNKLIGGMIDPSYYSVIVIAGWESGLAGPLSDFSSKRGKVVMLGDSLVQGPRKLGLASQVGEISETDLIDIVTNDSYITQPVRPDTVEIGSNVKISRVGGFIGSTLADYKEDTMLGTKNNFLIWGIVNPDSLDYVGANLTVRVLDYAVSGSGMEPG